MGHRDPNETEGRPAGRRSLLAIAGLCLLVAIGFVLAVATESLRLDGSALAAWIRGFERWGPAVVIALMIVHCFVPFPAEIVALCAGLVFGALLGTVLVWAGAMIGAALSFGLARWLGRGAVERLLAPRHRAALDSWARDQGTVTLLISRFIPVIAFNLINYAAGLTRVSWWTFLWTTGVGILPLTFLMVILGAEMRTLSWPALLGLSAVAIVTIWGLHWVAKRRGWLGGAPR